MDLPGLTFRPGKVLEAEILRKFGTPVCVPITSPSKGFFLVLSFGRCKYRLSSQSATLILRSVIGGSAELFKVIAPGERVFRFTVLSQDVGFHIYKLRSFECANFKVFFNLWHGGGPNHVSEFRRWTAEEEAQWTTIAKKPHPSSSTIRSGPLTGANAIPIRHSVDRRIPSSNSNSNLHQRQSAFSRLDYGVNLAGSKRRALPQSLNQNGILGRSPFESLGPCSRCMAHDHASVACPNQLRCKACRQFGHSFGNCPLPPRSPRQFSSFGDFFLFYTGKRPPKPLTIPWSRTWSLVAPEFPNEDDEVEVLLPPPRRAGASSLPPVFSSFGEFASSVLGIRSSALIKHISWVEKTPILPPPIVTPLSNP